MTFPFLVCVGVNINWCTTISSVFLLLQAHCSNLGGLDGRFGKGLWRFLRQIMPDAAFDDPVRIFAGEFLGIGAGIGVRCTVGIAFKGDGGHSDDRHFGKPLFQIVIFRLALSQAEPPAVIVDHDADVVRVVEGRPRCD